MRPDVEQDVEIVDYSDRYGNAFERLNKEWLEKYFRVETVDQAIFSDPQGTILDQGGVILYACKGDDAVGTVALKHCGDGVFELTKMAVTASCQGQGIGRRLLSAAIARFEQIGGSRLYLESNSALEPALALYESAGFDHESRECPSDYERADVFMVYRGG